MGWGGEGRGSFPVTVPPSSLRPLQPRLLSGFVYRFYRSEKHNLLQAVKCRSSVTLYIREGVEPFCSRSDVLVLFFRPVGYGGVVIEMASVSTLCKHLLVACAWPDPRALWGGGRVGSLQGFTAWIQPLGVAGDWGLPGPVSLGPA